LKRCKWDEGGRLRPGYGMADFRPRYVGKPDRLPLDRLVQCYSTKAPLPSPRRAINNPHSQARRTPSQSPTLAKATKGEPSSGTATRNTRSLEPGPLYANGARFGGDRCTLFGSASRGRGHKWHGLIPGMLAVPDFSKDTAALASGIPE